MKRTFVLGSFMAFFSVVTSGMSTGLTGCVGTTGSDLVTFTAEVRGPSVDANGAYSFSTSRGYDVTLNKAKMHIGALYLNRSVPQIGIQETSCVLPGIYVAQVTTGLDINLLTGQPVPFPASGEGSADRARVAEIWLNGADINADEDGTFVLAIEGTARRGTEEIPFQGALSIGSNRKQAAENPATPGSHPICRERIVSPISVDVTPSQGGKLVLDVDPAGWFSNVEFADLVTEGAEPPYEFNDSNNGQPSINLYRGLHDVSAPYRFSWQNLARAQLERLHYNPGVHHATRTLAIVQPLFVCSSARSLQQ